MADWDQCYYTFDGTYEAAQLKVFQEMFSKVGAADVTAEGCNHKAYLFVPAGLTKLKIESRESCNPEADCDTFRPQSMV